MNTYDKQRSDLKASYESKLKGVDLAEKLSDLPVEASVLRGNDLVVFDCTSIDEISTILKALPANVEKSYTKEYGSKKHIVESPYEMRLTSDISRGSGTVALHIQWQTELPNGTTFAAWVKAPANLIEEHIRRDTRSPTECEHVHFCGESASQIGRYKIQCASWTGTTGQLSYHGGQKTLIDAEKIAAVITYITK